jgi:hypothetical protein
MFPIIVSPGIVEASAIKIDREIGQRRRKEPISLTSVAAPAAKLRGAATATPRPILEISCRRDCLSPALKIKSLRLSETPADKSNLHGLRLTQEQSGLSKEFLFKMVGGIVKNARACISSITPANLALPAVNMMPRTAGFMLLRNPTEKFKACNETGYTAINANASGIKTGLVVLFVMTEARMPCKAPAPMD